MPDTCRVSTSRTLPDWGEYLSRHPHATVYHDPRWGEVMAGSYGNEPLYLSAWRQERVVGVLLLISQKSLLFGRHLSSVPYFDAAGILADDDAARNALTFEARRIMGELKAKWVELRQMNPLPDPAPPVRTDKVTLQLQLPDASEALWDQLRAKVRNQVRKATRSGLACVRGGAELLTEFHAVYARNMRDLGSPPHSLRFFRRIAEALPGAVRIFIVRQRDRPVGSSFTLSDRHAARVPWAGSDWRFRDLCPTMLLYWEMLADSCDRAAGLFDFGRSTRNAGTYQFKKQWGSQEVPLYWHYLLAEGQDPPGLRPDSPKYRFLVACWKKLPVWMVRVIGPRLIGKLS